MNTEDEETTNKICATTLIRGVHYFASLFELYDSLPHDEIEDFCKRNSAKLGENKLLFIINKALAWEVENR